MPLNIDLQQILLHLFNFVLLFAVLYFLLYRPVKDFMDKRAEGYRRLDEETRDKLAQAEQARQEYEEKLAGLDAELAEKRAQAAKELEAAGEASRRKAEAEAAQLLGAARRSMESEHAKMLRDAQAEIAGLAAQAAERIVEKRGTAEAYEDFLSAAERGDEHE